MFNLCKTIRVLSFSSITLVLYFLFSPLSTFAQTPETPTQEQTEQSNETPAPKQNPEVFKIPDKLQTSLPQEAAVLTPEENETPEWIETVAIFIKYVFYGILIMSVGFLAYMIIREIIRRRRNHAPKEIEDEAPPTPVYQPDAETARIVLDDADKLANEGRYTEAVHTLLFRSIQDIEDKRPHHVNNSLTSREISSLPILSRKAREGFSMISKLVEASFFGGSALNADDYNASKSAYKTFAFEKIKTT